MNRAIRVGVCTAAFGILQTVMVVPASAEYMGYGNGDPGNWDFNTEQAGGPCNLPGQRAVDAATGQPKCCSQYNPMSACPILGAAHTHYYRHARRQTHPQS